MSETERVKRRWDRWTAGASCCTTAQFADLDRGYVRHCGPTAATNAILTLRAGSGMKKTDAPATIFHICALTGMEMLTYWNTDFFGKFGGTSNLLTVPYIKACLIRTGMRGVRVGHVQKFSPARAARSLERGALLYLILRRHPRYGDHHALCCGGILSDRLYLFLEDGWRENLQTVPAAELAGSWYFEIRSRHG